MHFSGLLFFLSILEAGASAVTVIGIPLTDEKKIGVVGLSLSFLSSVVFYKYK